MRLMLRPAVKQRSAGPSVKKASDDDRAGIEKEAAWKLHGNRIAYAALGCFLAVAVGFTLFVMQSGEKPAPAKLEAKKEAAHPGSPPASAGTIRGSDTTARPQASTATGEVKATGGTGAQAVRAKRRRRPVPDAAGQDRRVTREAPPRRAAEEPDPDKVIDWLLKKRAEKRKRIMKLGTCNGPPAPDPSSGVFLWNLTAISTIWIDHGICVIQ